MSCKKSTLSIVTVTLLLVLTVSSCSTSGPSGLFGKKSPHQQYGDKLKDAGLAETALGKKWFEAASRSLQSPLTVALPYKETGYFPADEPKAVGLIFTGKRGEKINISLSTKPDTGFAVYMDLWEAATAADAKPSYIMSADTATQSISYEVDKEQKYLLRVQPELLKGGEYTVSIGTGPSLAFPVSPKVKSNIGSFWGAGRDGGSRSHEGIDIFAPKRSELVAAANGVITRVNTNNLGGKVIFLRPDNKNYTLYYAHLDEQLVQPGQQVKAGDVIGLVGNTGNARTTSPHLHFGIYTNSGAIDPLPFVNQSVNKPEAITASLKNLNKQVRNSGPEKLYKAPTTRSETLITLQKNTLLRVEAATSRWYKVTLPNGTNGFISAASVASVETPVAKSKLKTPYPLLDSPVAVAASKKMLQPGDMVSVLATYENYYYVSTSNNDGWVDKNAL